MLENILAVLPASLMWLNNLFATLAESGLRGKSTIEKKDSRIVAWIFYIFTGSGRFEQKGKILGLVTNGAPLSTGVM